MNSVSEIVKKRSKIDIFLLSIKDCDIDPKCHSVLKVSPQDYLLSKSHNSTVNCVWEIVKNVQRLIFSKFPVNTVLDRSRSPNVHHCEGLPTGYHFAKSHNFTVKKCLRYCQCLSLAQMVRRTDAIGSLHRLTLITHISQKDVLLYIASNHFASFCNAHPSTLYTTAPLILHSYISDYEELVTSLETFCIKLVFFSVSSATCYMW